MAEIVHSAPDFGMAAAGYTEGSLVFYAGQDVRLYGSAEDMLAAVPFAVEGGPVPEKKYVVAVDDAGLALMRSRKLVYYEWPRYVGCDAAAGFRPVAVTVVTNVPVRPAGTATRGEGTEAQRH